MMGLISQINKIFNDAISSEQKKRETSFPLEKSSQFQDKPIRGVRKIV